MRNKEEAKNKTNNDLKERTFQFAVHVIVLLKQLSKTKENDVMRYQLSKAATSVGANYEEAQSAFSKEDFTYKVGICLKEACESNYWLRLLEATEVLQNEELDSLIKESSEIKNIFGSIVKKSREG